MKTLSFINDYLFESPNNLILSLNRVIEDKAINVADFSNYDSGETLFLELKENEFTGNEIALFVSNLNEYKSYCERNFATDEDTQITISGLFYLHNSFFSNDDGICWDNKIKCYCRREQVNNLQFAN